MDYSDPNDETQPTTDPVSPLQMPLTSPANPEKPNVTLLNISIRIGAVCLVCVIVGAWLSQPIPKPEPAIASIPTPAPSVIAPLPIAAAIPKAKPKQIPHVDNEPSVAYLADSEQRLNKASGAIHEFLETMLSVKTIDRSEQFEWQKRLDSALQGISDEGYLLQQMPVTVSNGGEGELLPSVKPFQAKREELGKEMVEADYEMRESMPLLTEPPDRPVDQEKFMAATKRFTRVSHLYEETVRQLVIAKKSVK